MATTSSSVLGTPPIMRSGEHGGSGDIFFRRLLEQSSFSAPIDFVDYTVVPPGSVIGRHQHVGNEEMYFVVSGEPHIQVEEETRRFAPGGLSVVRDGQFHSLTNDTDQDVVILVVQVRVHTDAR